jgi:hypothetical protein
LIRQAKALYNLYLLKNAYTHNPKNRIREKNELREHSVNKGGSSFKYWVGLKIRAFSPTRIVPFLLKLIFLGSRPQVHYYRFCLNIFQGIATWLHAYSIILMNLIPRVPDSTP